MGAQVWNSIWFSGGLCSFRSIITMSAVRQAQHKEEISAHGKSIAFYDLDTPDFPKMNQSLKDAFASVAASVDSDDTIAAVRSIFMDSKMSALLISVSRLAVFSPEVADEFKHDLGLLKAVKTLAE